MSYIALIAVIVLPLTSLIDLDNATIEIITSISFWVSGMISTSLIFLPKVYILIQGKDIDWNEQRKDQQEIFFQHDSKIGTEVDSELIDYITKHLHGKSVDDKYVIAQLQVVWWKNLLMKLEEKRTSSQTSNPSKSSMASSVHVKDDDDPIMITATTIGGDTSETSIPV